MKSLEVLNENTEFKVVMKYNTTFKKKINLLYHLQSENNELASPEDLKII